MGISRKNLLQALSDVKPGLANQEVIEQSTSFVFSEGFVYTYNDELALSSPVDIQIEGAVQAKEFHALLSKIKDDKIDVEVKDGELIIKGEKIQSGIRLDAEVNLPFIAPDEDADWYDVPLELSDAFKVCVFSAAPESFSAALSSIHVKDNYAESCDNFRMTRYHFKEDIGGIELLVPSAAARVLAGYDLNVFTVQDGWIHFEDENTQLSIACRTWNEEYPDLSGLIDVEGDPMELPKALLGMLDRSSIFSQSGDSGLVEISIGGKKLSVRSENDRGWVQEESDITSKNVYSFNISPDILKDILKIATNATLGEHSIKFETKDFDHVVSLSVG